MLTGYVEGFGKAIGVHIKITDERIFNVISNADRVLRTNVRMKTPSVFKRAAAFSVGFMIESPIDESFGTSLFGAEMKISHIQNHQNAVVAFEYARDCLHGATYTRILADEQQKPVVLSNPIKLSRHFYCDLIRSLTAVPKDSPKQLPSFAIIPSPVFHTMALLYESMCYMANHGMECHDPLEV